MNADHVGRECTRTILGRSWTFARSTRAIHTQFAEWARTVLPDPVEAVLRNLDKIAAKDVEIRRQVLIANAREEITAKKESREPVLVVPQETFSDAMTRQAVQKASCYLGFGSPEINSVLSSTDGTSYMLYLLLREHQPDVTPEKAFEILVAMGPETGKVIEQCSGRAEGPSKNGAVPVGST